MMRTSDVVGKPYDGSRIRRPLALLVMLMGASCSNSLNNGAPPQDYVILTDAGPVLVNADGFAHGFTQSALEAAVRKGVTRAHRGQVRLLDADETAPPQRMLLHVEEGFRPTRAQVTLELFRAGKLIRSVSMAAPEPGAFPEAVFIHSVTALARQLLPTVG